MKSKFRTRPMVTLFVVTAALAAYVATASATGRTLAAEFCTTNTGSSLCMALTWDGVEYGTRNREDLSLRPGTYSVTLNDNSPFHNFALRSCPDSAAPCETGDVDELTTVPDQSGEVTIKIRLGHGTYRLFCAPHETAGPGMYVDFAVGGVGKLK